MTCRFAPERRGRRRRVVASLLCLLGGLLSFAADPPDAALNPRSGLIETVDSTFVNGALHIRHTTALRQDRAKVALLTNASTDDTDPRIAVAGTGDTYVTWCRTLDPPEIVVLRRTYSTQTWSTEQVVSSPGEASRHPQIVHDGTQAWIAYEFDDAAGTSVAVAGGGDSPGPWPGRTLVATTVFTGDRDLTISVESGRLWVTWVDSNSNVGWVQYDYATRTWSTSSFESYADDSVSGARGRIRTRILGS